MTADPSDRDSLDDTIHFKCLRCGQRIQVSRKRRGDVVHCPKCDRSIQIPKIQRPPEEQSTARETQDELPVINVVYERSSPTPSELNQRLIQVPRVVVWMQGLLLLSVGVSCFFFGTLLGRSLETTESDATQSSIRRVFGTIVYLDAMQRPIPDAGAVVICLPKDRRPELNAKAQFDGLRPGDPIPGESHPSLVAIQRIGGTYLRTGDTGKYEFSVREGNYYVLIISRQLTSPANEPKSKSDLAQLGRYVESAVDLIGERGIGR